MKRRPNTSHLLSFQGIEIKWFNLLSVIQYTLNWVSFLIVVLPKMDYSHPEAYRDLWRHK